MIRFAVFFIANVGTLMGPTPIFSSGPPPDTNHILTEAGDNIATESGDLLVTES